MDKGWMLLRPVRPPQRLGSCCLLTQRGGVRMRLDALHSMCLLAAFPHYQIAPHPFVIAYRRLANAVSDRLGGCEGLEGLGEGDGEGDGGLVEAGDLCDRVKVGWGVDG